MHCQCWPLSRRKPQRPDTVVGPVANYTYGFMDSERETLCEVASSNIAKLKAKRPMRVLVMGSSREAELVDDMMASGIVGMAA